VVFKAALPLLLAALRIDQPDDLCESLRSLFISHVMTRDEIEQVIAFLVENEGTMQGAAGPFAAFAMANQEAVMGDINMFMYVCMYVCMSGLES
jgi:hypothetical protein